jgi:hypothetical protein
MLGFDSREAVQYRHLEQCAKSRDWAAGQLGPPDAGASCGGPLRGQLGRR